MAHYTGQVAQYARACSRHHAESLRSRARLATLVQMMDLGNPVRRCTRLHASVLLDSMMGRVPVEQVVKSSAGYACVVGCESRRMTLADIARKHSLTVTEVRRLIAEAKQFIEAEVAAADDRAIHSHTMQRHGQ